MYLDIINKFLCSIIVNSSYFIIPSILKFAIEANISVTAKGYGTYRPRALDGSYNDASLEKESLFWCFHLRRLETNKSKPDNIKIESNKIDL